MDRVDITLSFIPDVVVPEHVALVVVVGEHRVVAETFTSIERALQAAFVTIGRATRPVPA